MAKARAKCVKETIEYDSKSLNDWNQYCAAKGYVKRQASHACRMAFMKLSATKREEFMQKASKSVAASRKKRK
jgi:hypothetical protein